MGNTESILGTCPLEPNWRSWDMFPSEVYNFVPDEFKAVLAAARTARLSAKLRVLDLAWRVADDDASKMPMTTKESGQPDSRFAVGCPFHIHAGTLVEGNNVHIDWFGATKCGPGRSVLQVRLYVNGSLAGRGVRCGCSLGIGGNNLPAVALVGRQMAIQVNEGSSPPRKETQQGDTSSNYRQNDASTQSPLVELWRTED